MTDHTAAKPPTKQRKPYERPWISERRRAVAYAQTLIDLYGIRAEDLKFPRSVPPIRMKVRRKPVIKD